MSQVDSSELLKKKTPGSANRRRAHGAVADRVDVAIIGSGLGGLVAAGYLAQQGLSVSVFESHYTAGGCATQVSRTARGGNEGGVVTSGVPLFQRASNRSSSLRTAFGSTSPQTAITVRFATQCRAWCSRRCSRRMRFTLSSVPYAARPSQ